MMMKLMNVALVASIALAVGCRPAEVATTPDTDSAAPAAAGSEYLVDSEPAGAVGVGQARQDSENDQAVTLVGIVGGSTKPFVDGLAAFTIVDPKVPYCAADEGCATPWDYCCETEAVKDNIATVKVVDAEGKPVATDARELLKVKELSTVVVEGTAQRDDQGNLSVLAKKVYVRPAG
ncbi:hypothetical protein UC8_03790 [Roseimaritima ulvae]|uniref:Uncharacterized protein n=2 Tax=Roseimaritima ulvae TaxID=980254 RepID=A0A5B9QKY0_9BACT|nr:hypothetical protein UC8_03790 [Roseimaritima ulvae]